MKRIFVISVIILSIIAFLSFNSLKSEIAISSLNREIKTLLGDKYSVESNSYSGSLLSHHKFSSVKLKLDNKDLVSFGNILINKNGQNMDINLEDVIFLGRIDDLKYNLSKKSSNATINCRINSLKFKNPIYSIKVIKNIVINKKGDSFKLCGKLNNRKFEITKNRNLYNFKIKELFSFLKNNLKLKPYLDLLKSRNVTIDNIKEINIEGEFYKDGNKFRDINVFADIKYKNGKIGRISSLYNSKNNYLIRGKKIQFKIKNHKILSNFMINNGNGTFDSKIDDIFIKKYIGNLFIDGMINFNLSTFRYNLISKYKLINKSNLKKIAAGSINYDGKKLEFFSDIMNNYNVEFMGKYDIFSQSLNGKGKLSSDIFNSNFKIKKSKSNGSISGSIFPAISKYKKIIPQIDYKIDEKLSGKCIFRNIPYINKDISGNIIINKKKLYFKNSMVNLNVGLPENGDLLPSITGNGLFLLNDKKIDFNISNNKKNLDIKGKILKKSEKIAEYNLNIDKKTTKLKIKKILIGNFLSISGNYADNLYDMIYKINISKMVEYCSNNQIFSIPKPLIQYIGKIFNKKYELSGNIRKLDNKFFMNTFLNGKEVVVYRGEHLFFKDFTIHDFIINGEFNFKEKNSNCKISMNDNSNTSIIVKHLLGFNKFEILSNFKNNEYNVEVKNKNLTIANIAMFSKNGRLYSKNIRIKIGAITFYGKGNIDSKGRYSGHFHSERITENILNSFGLPKMLKGFDNIDIDIYGENGKFNYSSTIYNFALYSKIYSKLVLDIKPLENKGYITKIRLIDNQKIVGKSNFFINEIKNFNFSVMGFLELKKFTPGETKIGKNFINPGIINLRVDFEKKDQNLIATGNGNIKNGYFRNKYGTFIKNIRGNIKVKNEKILLNNLSSNLKSDNINIDGWVQPVSKLGKADYNIDLESNKVSLHNLLSGLMNLNSLSESDVTLKLKLFPENDLININGNIMLSKGLLNESDMDKLKTINSENNTFFNLHILLEEKLKLKTLLFESVTTGNIDVYGIGKDLSISGDIYVNSGKIHYLGKNFIIETGKINFSTLSSPSFICSSIKRKIDFNNSNYLSGIMDYKYTGIKHSLYLENANNDLKNKVRAELTMKGKTRENGRDIFINISGTKTNLSVKFNAEPNMDEDEIEYMLFGIKLKGKNRENSMDDNKEKFLCFVENQLQSAIWNKIGDSLEKKFNLDEFSIKTDRENEANPFMSDLEINIGKFINKELFISYSKKIIDSSKDYIGMEYKFGNHLFLGGKLNQENELSMDARVGITF